MIATGSPADRPFGAIDKLEIRDEHVFGRAMAPRQRQSAVGCVIVPLGRVEVLLNSLEFHDSELRLYGRITAAVTGPPPRNYDFKPRVIGGSR